MLSLLKIANFMPTLTPKQKKIFDFIKNYIKKNGISPTFGEISCYTKKSFSTVHEHVEALISKGFLTKTNNSSRGIELTKPSEMVKIPLLGTIAAGQPIEAVQEKEVVAVSKEKLPHDGNFYALKVSGNSMFEDNINDGDYIIVKQQNTAENGQNVVALIENNDVTLKKYYNEHNQIRLQPANKSYPPIFVKHTDIQIQGIMIDIIKNNPTHIDIKFDNKIKSDDKNDSTLKKWINTIQCSDCVNAMKKLPNNSIDMVVTSPPYDKIRDYKGFSYDLHAAGKEIFRILKDGGIAIMVIQDQTKNFGKSLTSFRTIIDWCDNIGFKLFETIIYKKHGAEGAWWTKRFRVDHEYIPVFLKGERPLYFNKNPLKIPSKHGGKTMTGCATRLTNGATLKSHKVTINPLKCRGTIWDYTTCGDGTKLKHRHPATFPDKLPFDFIQCFCPEKGIVLDPFIGSGTTALAAIQLDRNFIGIDISPEYCELTKKRLREESKDKQNKLF